MRKYRQRFIWQKLFHSTTAILILAVAIVFLSLSFLVIYKKYLFTKSEYAFSVQQREEAENRNLVNQAKLEEIQSEEGKEKYIRETYAVKKPGEGMIIVYDSPKTTYDIPTAPSKWEAFKKYLKELFKLD